MHFHFPQGLVHLLDSLVLGKTLLSRGCSWMHAWLRSSECVGILTVTVSIHDINMVSEPCENLAATV